MVTTPKKKTFLKHFMVFLFAVLFFLQCAPAAWGKAGVKTGGRLDVGFTQEESLESLTCGESWQYLEMGCVFWPLVYDQLWIMGPAPEYEAKPMLAKSWETEDHQTWTFHLQEDARFHDGEPVTAEDVKFSLINLRKADPAWAYEDTNTESITIIDEHTIQFTLKAKHGGKYPPAYWTPVIPEHIWGPHQENMLSYDNAQAIGSGKFKLKEFKPGQFLWLQKNEEYWGQNAYVDDVVFRCYGSQDAVNMALKKGEIDMVGYLGIPSISAEDFKGLDDIRFIAAPGISMDWLTFNLHQENPIQDLKVRKAIMHGIDTERLVNMVFFGYAQEADSFIYPELPTHNPNLPQYEYDTDTAVQLLESGGYTDTDGDGLRNDPETGDNLVFDFLAPSAWPDEIKCARLMKEQLQKIGIKLNLKITDLSTYYGFYYDPMSDEFDISIATEEPGPHADWVWEFCRSDPEGEMGWNGAYYNNPEFDDLLNKMAAATDMEKRKALLYEMQQIIAEDLPYGFLIRPDMISPVRVDQFEGYVETMGGVSTWINPWSYFNVHLK